MIQEPEEPPNEAAHNAKRGNRADDAKHFGQQMRVFPPAQGSFVELKSQQREHQPKLGSLLVVPLVISPVASVASTHPSLDHGA